MANMGYRKVWGWDYGGRLGGARAVINKAFPDSPREAKNECCCSNFSISYQIQGSVSWLSFGLWKLLCLKNTFSHLHYKVTQFHDLQRLFCGKSKSFVFWKVQVMFLYTVICEDVLWSLNFVHFSSLSYYGLSFLPPSAREQPPWRLWNEPASVARKKEEIQGSRKAHKSVTTDFHRYVDCPQYDIIYNLIKVRELNPDHDTHLFVPSYYVIYNKGAFGFHCIS